MADREINCSFCGRKKSEVDILIAGVTGHICDPVSYTHLTLPTILLV